jgi:hypothetical protein
MFYHSEYEIKYFPPERPQTSTDYMGLHSRWQFSAYQTGWHNCSALELFSGDSRFESQPGYWLSWLRCFVVFFFAPGNFLENTFIRLPRLPSESFPIHLSLITLPFEYHSLVGVLEYLSIIISYLSEKEATALSINTSYCSMRNKYV